MAKDKRKVTKKAERQIRLSRLRNSAASVKMILDGMVREIERLEKLEGRNER